MNILHTARTMTWLTSHPGYRTHAFALPVRILRWEWYRMKRRPVVLPLYDFEIEARPTDGVGRLICYFREQADSLFAFMKTYLKPGMTFVDVGANIGTHTVHGSRLVANSGKVYSFEADPATFKVLEENTRFNSAENVVLYNQCVSDKPGTVAFNINSDSARSSLLRKGTSQTELLANTLDRLLPTNAAVDLLKIDVEGADYLVLRGAQTIFANRPPRVVVVETSSFQKEIHEFLRSYGYRIYRFAEESSTLVELEWPAFNTCAIRDSSQPEFANFRFVPRTPAE